VSDGEGGPYEVQFTDAAARDWRKLDKAVQRRLRPKIDGLERNPRPPGCNPLTGYPGYFRIRVADYRIVYTIDDGVLLVLVLTIGHRSTIYNRLPREQPRSARSTTRATASITAPPSKLSGLSAVEA
jgi:mRNA interferase RelE/StbE